MARRKLTPRQVERIKQLQDGRRERAAARRTQHRENAGLGPERHGLIVARFGKATAVEDEAGGLHHCTLRQNLGEIVCGDRVVWQEADDGSGVVCAVTERASLLERHDSGGRPKPMAANIDRIVVVAAPLPELSPPLIDRYLAAAELTGIEPLLVINKIDLLDDQARAALERTLAPYRATGYPQRFASTHTAHGLDALREALAGHTAILTGQSGVGKSSLIRALLPHHEIAVGELHAATGLGTHTTTTATLYHLPEGGALIDSPGIREFGLWEVGADELESGFREIHRTSPHCRFRNCRHQAEPGCAVKAAVERGGIAATRLASYHALLEELAPAR
ncbi:small ribosomal subunit biogenesis GTPase RsgA [Endothiovibrio diazotrophicus]